MRTVSQILLFMVFLVACGSTSAETPSLVGDWEMVEGTLGADPFPLVEGRRITLNLAADGTLGGTAACNGYGGRFVADGEDLLVDKNELVSTEMGCEPNVMESEAAFLQALRSPLTYKRDGDRLTLLDLDLTMVFSAVAPVATADILGTEWILESLLTGDSVSSVSGDPATLLMADDGTLVGSTGCRLLEGQYVVDADRVRFTSFAALGECNPDLADQDNFVVSVLGDGFTSDVEGDLLTIVASGGEGLIYRSGG